MQRRAWISSTKKSCKRIKNALAVILGTTANFVWTVLQAQVAVLHAPANAEHEGAYADKTGLKHGKEVGA